MLSLDLITLGFWLSLWLLLAIAVMLCKILVHKTFMDVHETVNLRTYKTLQSS